MDLEYIKSIVPTLHGWCTVDKAIHLYKLVCDHDTPLCVELGVFAGRSLLPIALAARSKSGTAVGIDAWSKNASQEGTNDPANTKWWNNIDYEFFYNYTTNVIKTAGLTGSTLIIRSKTSDICNHYTSESISLLHQDSNHSEENTVDEVNLWYDKLKIGGYWVFDDANWATTQKAQEILLTKGYKLMFSEKEDSYKVYVRIS
jgi:hypothetical protein